MMQDRSNKASHHFWKAFWLAQIVFAANYFVVWLGPRTIPHRAVLFSLIVPAWEALFILVIAAGLFIANVNRKAAHGLFVATALQIFPYFIQAFYLAMYAGLGDNAGFFK